MNIIEILILLSLLLQGNSYISIKYKRMNTYITMNNNNKVNPTVWEVFSQLAESTQSSNLGQGFPDWNPPEFVLDSLKLVSSEQSKYHQYTRPSGHMPLVDLISKRYSLHLDRYIDPINEVVITVGATQALYLSFITLLSKDDEIIIFEPFFDLYLKQIKQTKAIPKYVALGGNSSTLDNPWALDIDALKCAITPKTKILLLNSPHNPTGKVFTLKELEAIADIVRENPQIIVISDEVYKFTVYNAKESGDPTTTGHYHFARLPGMWDRTITLSSCGKTFSVTGWQVGWMIGPSKYIQPIQNVIPCLQFCASTPIQQALTYALKQADQPYNNYNSYYEWLRSQFNEKRDILEDGLSHMGIKSIQSEGGFFLIAHLPIIDSVLQQSIIKNEPYDWTYCKYLANNYGVVGIPASPFFNDNSSIARSLGPMARFAFCKKDSTLLEASRRLKDSLRTYNKNSLLAKN